MAKLEVTVPENSLSVLGIVTIQAPLEKVFEAYVNEDLFKQWWAQGNPLTIHTFDAVDGGKWHVSDFDEERGESEFIGYFHEVARNERIVQTFEFLGMPERGHVAIEKAEFVKIDDGTTQINTCTTFQNMDDRDGMIGSGMEDGWRKSIEALGALIEKE